MINMRNLLDYLDGGGDDPGGPVAPFSGGLSMGGSAPPQMTPQATAPGAVAGLGGNALMQQWLTTSNQGNLFGGNDGEGPSTDYQRMLAGDPSVYEQARQYGYDGPAGFNLSEEGGMTQNPEGQRQLMEWMQASGNQYGLIPTYNGGQIGAWLNPQGQEAAGTRREIEAPDDSAFWRAGMLAGGLVLGPAGIGAFSSAPAAMAASSGVGTYAGGGSVGDALRAAAQAGATTYLGGQISDYLTGPSAIDSATGLPNYALDPVPSPQPLNLPEGFTDPISTAGIDQALARPMPTLDAGQGYAGSDLSQLEPSMLTGGNPLAAIQPPLSIGAPPAYTAPYTPPDPTPSFSTSYGDLSQLDPSLLTGGNPLAPIEPNLDIGGPPAYTAPYTPERIEVNGGRGPVASPPAAPRPAAATQPAAGVHRPHQHRAG